MIENPCGAKGKNMVNKKSRTFVTARDSLPENLRPTYDKLVDQYAFHTTRLYGKEYVAYEVLASLVREGWRHSDTQNDS